MTSLFNLGQLFHDRYLIQLDLGQGRLSRNYLANDTHRFDEPCLVKVFFPHPDVPIPPDNALKLFQQQARTLYSLDHPQIANFREFFSLASPDHLQYYLVQDFVEGQTYDDLLSLRRSQGQTFSEGEIKDLFRELLPVLSYLHDRGVFHRQLIPVNIVRRDLDGLPMLVEFSDAPPDDLAGSPILKNVVGVPAGPGQDLGSLGVSGVMLLSGQRRIPGDQSTSFWQEQLDLLPLSQEFRRFLGNLLRPSTESGFDSAASVLAILDTLPVDAVIKPIDPPTTQSTLGDRVFPEPQFVENDPEPAIPPPASLSSPPDLATAAPVNTVSSSSSSTPSVISRTITFSSPLPLPKSMIKSKGITGFFKKALLLLGLMAIAIGMGWGAGKLWLNWRAQADLMAAQNAPPPPKTPLELKNEIRTRRLNLGISSPLFQALVNDWLAFKFNQLPTDPTDPTDPTALPPGTEADQLQTAIALLTALETLSPDALNFLAKDSPPDRRRWIPRVNQLRLSSRSFDDLVNARFDHYFPDLDPDAIKDRPLDQLWNALALDSLISLEDGSHYQRVSLVAEPTLSLSGLLEPGEGYAYAINISQGQGLDLKLDAPATTRISFTSPSGQERMLENSANHQWSGLLNETGYYELAITSDAPEPISFQLQLQVRPGE